MRSLWIMCVLTVHMVSLYGQATITSVSNGLWDNPDTWDCDCIPDVNDEVIIAQGTVVTIDNNYVNRNNPGPTVTTPEDEGVAGGHPGQNRPAFIHRGDFTVELGGTFRKTGTSGNNDYVLFAGTSNIFGAFDTSDRLYNLGTLNVDADVTINLGNDFVVGVDSRSNIDGLIISNDDIYVVGDLATLCGEGIIQILDIVQLFPSNLDVEDQLCEGFQIIDGDGNIILEGTNGALPITVRFFVVEADQLVWAVLEQNVHYYEVMFSENGREWTILGTVLANGDGEHTYRYDITREGFYFIQSVDYDGTPDQTPVISFLSKSSQPRLHHTWLKRGQSLMIDNASRLLQVTIVSLNGQVLTFSPDREIRFDLPKGVYVVSLHTVNEVITERMLID